MGNTWVIQFSYYHVYFRISDCMTKKTVTSSVYIHVHTANALISILSEFYHISRKSNIKEKLSSVIRNNKGAEQPAHPCSLISNFVICFLRRIISGLAISQTSIFLASMSEETGLRLALSETQKIGFLVSWACIFLLLARSSGYK